jgi:hypothetical protein
LPVHCGHCAGRDRPQRRAEPETDVRFTDFSSSAGVNFRQINGASPDKHLAETIGSAGLFFDFDNDGWIDIFLVDGGSLAEPAVARQARTGCSGTAATARSTT